MTTDQRLRDRLRSRRRSLRDDYSSERLLDLEDQDDKIMEDEARFLGYGSDRDMRVSKSDSFGKVVGISVVTFAVAALSLRNYQRGLGLNPVAGLFS